MRSVLVTTSRSHPVRDDVVTETVPHDWHVEIYEVEADGLERGSVSELAAAAAGHDALLLRPGRATRELFETVPSLRALAVHGSGYSRVDLDAATDHGVAVTHSPEAPGPAVVEHTVCAMMVLLRELTTVHERTTAGEWDTAKSQCRELGRRTVGLVGLGTIGFDVARAVRAFGADVLAFDPYVAGERDDSAIYPRTDREAAVDLGVEFVAFEDLLTRADVLSLHAPLTDATRGMIGAAELETMAGGYLLNVARGGLVDEAALADAVAAGALEGVALDVMREEPPPADDPLLTSPDVLVTPHVAGVTDGYLERGARLGAEKIETMLSGGRPDTVVNPAVFESSPDPDGR